MQTVTDTPFQAQHSGIRGFEPSGTQGRPLNRSIRGEELIKKIKNSHGESEAAQNLSCAERLSHRAISVIGSRYTTGAVISLYIGALATSLVASILDYEKNSDDCTRPIVPLILDIASAVVSLTIGGLEVLETAVTDSDEDKAKVDDLVNKATIVFDRVADMRERRRADDHPEYKTQDEKFDQLISEVKDCKRCFDALPEDAQKELSVAHLIYWLLQDLHDDHPLKRSINSRDAPQPEDPVLQELIEKAREFAWQREQCQDDVVINFVNNKVTAVGSKESLENKNLPDSLESEIENIKNQFQKFQNEKKRKQKEALKNKNFCVRLIQSKQKDLVQQILIAVSILLSGASSITDLIVNNENNCDRPTSVLVLSGTSIGLLSVVACIWMTYWGLKKNINENDHDQKVFNEFLQLFEERLTDDSHYQIAELNAKIRHCLKLYDDLSQEKRKKLPDRALVLISLVDTLPPEHPIRRKIDEAVIEPRRRTLSKEPPKKIKKELHAKVDEVFRDIEGIAGGPVNFVAFGDHYVTRDYQIRELESLINTNFQLVEDPSKKDSL